MDIEKYIEDMCDNYCKWPEWFNSYFEDPDTAWEVMDKDCCVNCPLRLLKAQLNK